MKRTLSAEERDLFETVLQDTVLLNGIAPQPKKKAHSPGKPVASESPRQKETRNKASRLGPPGLDGNTIDRLRRGLLEPQARLDLHGLTQQAAHRALLNFMRGAKSRKLRLVLIVTGKGQAQRGSECENSSSREESGSHARGVLRAMTPRWLREPDLASLVADLREAHRRHGGAGALYVYLRKE